MDSRNFMAKLQRQLKLGVPSSSFKAQVQKHKPYIANHIEYLQAVSGVTGQGSFLRATTYFQPVSSGTYGEMTMTTVISTASCETPLRMRTVRRSTYSPPSGEAPLLRRPLASELGAAKLLSDSGATTTPRCFEPRCCPMQYANPSNLTGAGSAVCEGKQAVTALVSGGSSPNGCRAAALLASSCFLE